MISLGLDFPTGIMREDFIQKMGNYMPLECLLGQEAKEEMVDYIEFVILELLQNYQSLLRQQKME